MPNPDVAFDLPTAVSEVLGLLTGLTINYIPEQERFYSVTQAINRALRKVATDAEWSYYNSVEDIGTCHMGVKEMDLRATVRPRILTDDAVRLCTVDSDGNMYPRRWAYFLPREAIEKQPNKEQLWVASARSALIFSRPFSSGEEGLHVMVPVMREPKMYRLPPRPLDPDADLTTVSQTVLDQLVDFEWPDLIVLKAAYFYAQTQPVMQPRVQTLDSDYKDLMYNLTERDSRITDSPKLNPYDVPVDGDIFSTRNVSHVPYGEERFYGHARS